MCAKKSVITSKCGTKLKGNELSPAPGKTIRSGYRVLRVAISRGIPRSVNRDCVGRNAKSKETSVKVSSPDKQLIFVVAEQVWSSEGNTEGIHSQGTTGVQVHGMYRRRLLELGRSPKGRARKLEVKEQGIIAKFATNLMGEVRWPHSSWEVG